LQQQTAVRYANSSDVFQAMKSRLVFTTAILSMATCIGCIDVNAIGRKSGVDAGAGAQSIVIATFESGTGTPDDPRFEPFRYYSYNPSLPDLPPGAFVRSPVVSPGFDSNYALRLQWEVIDVPDGQPNYPGAGVGTVVNGFIDLSTYTVFMFFQEYQHTGGCEPDMDLVVSLGCSQYNASVVGTVPLSTEGTTTSLQLSSFSQSPYLGQPSVALSDCLKVVDAVDFQTQLNLADGDCASGELILDNIGVRRLAPSDGGS
jgi:hypothetical protein